MALALDIWWPSSTEGPPAPAPRLVFDCPRIVVGRGESCDIRLPDPTVSARHASIRQRGADYVLLDEGSTNGTVLDTVRLPPQSPRVLKAGDRVRVGAVWLVVGFDASAWPTPPARARAVAVDRVLQVLAREGEDVRPSLEVVEGPDAGRSLRLDPDRTYVIGRAEVDVRLADELVGRRHVEVRREGDAVLVRDLGSRAGTLLGDRPVGDKEIAWRPGTPLHLGETTLALRFEAITALAEIERSPDQKLRPDECPPFPLADPEVVAPPILDAPAEHAAFECEPSPRPAPVHAIAKRDEARWRVLDFLVVLLALGVLTVSGAGLVYLMRSWA